MHCVQGSHLQTVVRAEGAAEVDPGAAEVPPPAGEGAGTRYVGEVKLVAGVAVTAVLAGPPKSQSHYLESHPSSNCSF